MDQNGNCMGCRYGDHPDGPFCPKHGKYMIDNLKPCPWLNSPPEKAGAYVVTSTVEGRKQEASLAVWDGDVWKHWSGFYDHAITHYMPTDLSEEEKQPMKTPPALEGDVANLLADAMLFIRRRHNYGPKRRKEERLALMKRYSEFEMTNLKALAAWEARK